MAFFDSKSPGKPKLIDSIVKLEEIQSGLRQTLANLHEAIEVLESESPDFQENIDNLQEDVETRAFYLEAEVKRLRADLKSIREILGLNLDQKDSGKT